MNIKKTTYLALILLLWGNVAIAARNGKFGHDIYGSFNMLSSNLVPVSTEDNSMGMGFGGGFGYLWRINPSLNLRTGLNANYYRSTTGLTGFTETSPAAFPPEWWDGTDPKPTTEDAYNFTVESNLESYLAQQSALYLQLPLLLEFESMFQNAEYLGWYIAGGAKAGYAISGYSDADFQNLTTRANLAYQMVDGVDAPEFLGFGVTINENVKSKLDLGFQAVGYLELGFKQQLADKYALYAGFFGEYCLYSTVSAASQNMLEYKVLPEGWSQLGQGGKAYQFRYNPSANVAGNSVKETYPLSFGITVRISYSLTTKPKERNERLFNVRYF
jgi:hypothetical protein